MCSNSLVAFIVRSYFQFYHVWCERRRENWWCITSYFDIKWPNNCWCVVNSPPRSIQYNLENVKSDNRRIVRKIFPLEDFNVCSQIREGYWLYVLYEKAIIRCSHNCNIMFVWKYFRLFNPKFGSKWFQIKNQIYHSK